MLAVDKYVQIIIFTAKLFNLFILRLENSITFYKIYCRKQVLSTSLFIPLLSIEMADESLIYPKGNLIYPHALMLNFILKLVNCFILRLENSITFYKEYCRKQTLSTSLFIRLAALMPVVTNNHRLGSFYCTPFEYYYREIFSLPFLSYYH